MSSMSVPPQFAWIIPVIIPLIMGLLVGAIIKRTIKLLTILIALFLVLVATGAVSLSFPDIYNRAMELLPKLIEPGSEVLNVLPYSSVTFLIGLALGLWRG